MGFSKRVIREPSTKSNSCSVSEQADRGSEGGEREPSADIRADRDLAL